MNQTTSSGTPKRRASIIEVHNLLQQQTEKGGVILDLTAPEVSVLLCLAGHANDGNDAYPSQSTLAVETKYTTRTVGSALRSLVEKGYIEHARDEDGKVEVKSYGAGVWTYRYNITLPDRNVVPIGTSFRSETDAPRSETDAPRSEPLSDKHPQNIPRTSPSSDEEEALKPYIEQVVQTKLEARQANPNLTPLANKAAWARKVASKPETIAEARELQQADERRQTHLEDYEKRRAQLMAEG